MNNLLEHDWITSSIQRSLDESQQAVVNAVSQASKSAQKAREAQWATEAATQRAVDAANAAVKVVKLHSDRQTREALISAKQHRDTTALHQGMQSILTTCVIISTVASIITATTLCLFVFKPQSVQVVGGIQNVR